MKITERLDKETAREYALRMLRDNIISLDLVPGSIVSEKDLAAELGLSRTPVGEALTQLGKSQIVEIFPQRGNRVSLIDMDLVEEARFLRVVLETAVVELACDVLTEQELPEFQENLMLQEFYVTNSNPSKVLELDNRFHRRLFELCRKGQIYGMMDSITIHYDRVRTLSLQTVKDTKIVKDHRGILNAIMNHDRDTAVEIMKKHLNRYKLDEQQIREKYSQYFKN